MSVWKFWLIGVFAVRLQQLLQPVDNRDALEPRSRSRVRSTNPQLVPNKSAFARRVKEDIDVFGTALGAGPQTLSNPCNRNFVGF